ncbi:hypothetical protein ACHAXM_004289 [Skeletonema potamos]
MISVFNLVDEKTIQGLPFSFAAHYNSIRPLKKSSRLYPIIISDLRYNQLLPVTPYLSECKSMGSPLRMARSLRRGAAASFVATVLTATIKQPTAAGFLTNSHLPRSSRIFHSSSHYADRQSSSTVSELKMTNNEGDRSTTKSGSLFLFDFDGVVCDSCDECTVSAWRTCKILNAIPNNFDTTLSDDGRPPQWLFGKMREIRPAIEVGWQIPVLLSVFLDQHVNSSPSNPALSVPEVLDNYEQLVEDWLTKYNLKEKDMIDTFGQVRDDWISEDMKSWLDINTFYQGISQAINECTGEAVLVTTKQQRFATALVRHAGVTDASMPDDSIYGLGMYKTKADVIADRMQQGGYESAHFFEDRYPTIAKALKDDRLENVAFYLCSWGYCTDKELQLASEEPRVKVLNLEDFASVVTS